MLGIIILIAAIALYFYPKYRVVSLFLYLCFMMGAFGGQNILTDDVIGISNEDLAIGYTLVLNIYLLAINNWKIPKLSFIKPYIGLLIFLAGSAVFSFFYYELSPLQIIQAIRNLFLLLSIPIFYVQKREELLILLKILSYTCLIIAVLYIIQVVLLRAPLLPYPYKPNFDKTTGLPRLLNYPANLVFFLSLSFIDKSIFPKFNINISRIILLLALLCTLGRTFMAVGIISVLLTIFISGNLKNLKRNILVLMIMILPFIGVISTRYIKGGTSEDIEQIFDGTFTNFAGAQNRQDATMLYRMAWLYERADYLIQRPIGEKIFGMGLCSDSQKWVNQKYNFQIGIYDENAGKTAQLRTPDIAYGNLLTRLGFGGTIIFLVFHFSLILYLWRRRKMHPILTAICAVSITYLIESFSGDTISNIKNYALIFMIICIFDNQHHDNTLVSHDSSTH